MRRNNNARSTNGGGRSEAKSNFMRIGSVTVSKKTTEEYKKDGDNVVEMLQDSGIQLWVQIYLPKGTDALNVKHGEKLLLSLKEVEKAPDFVVGTVAIENK